MREALERAIALGRQALATDPRDSDTWARLAGWLSNLKEHGPAIESVQRALELSPGDVSNMARAGFVYLGAGDRENALHWIDEAVRHGHGTETLRRAPETQDLLDDPDFHRILERGVASDGP
jgi:tetratricopeptide (TPR) repeat protein